MKQGLKKEEIARGTLPYLHCTCLISQHYDLVCSVAHQSTLHWVPLQLHLHWFVLVQYTQYKSHKM